MDTTMTHAEGRSRRSVSRHGFLPVIGTVQIITGTFYLLISAFGLFALFASGGPSAFGLSQLFAMDGAGEGWRLHLRNVIEGLLVLQILAGGLLGALTIMAGLRSQESRSREFIKWVNIANLFYFPVGTTVGAVVLVGLSRPDVRRRFADEARRPAPLVE